MNIIIVNTPLRATTNCKSVKMATGQYDKINISSIECYIFFDIETTGLPHKERNRTKIIELCMLAVLKNDLINANLGEMPKVHNKISMLLYPNRDITSEIIELTGISNEDLKYAPTFKDSFKSVISFLEDLPKPLCIVAHNGNTFDYKILLSECRDAKFSIPDYVLCIDSLVGFRKLLKGTTICYDTLKQEAELNDLMTDDEDSLDSTHNFQIDHVSLNTSIEQSEEVQTILQLNTYSESKLEMSTNSEDDVWPELNISTEEWQEVDDLCKSLAETSCEDVSALNKMQTQVKQKTKEPKKQKTEAIKNVFNKKSETKKETFKLPDVYKRLLNKMPENLHRAEADCLLLAECVVALREKFLPWAEKTKMPLNTIKPFIPY